MTLAAFLAASAANDQARPCLTQALERGLPWNWARPRALWSGAEAAARLGDANAASVLHRLVIPYDGMLRAAYGGWMIDGSAATALGQLETVIGRFADADAHFRAGVAIEEHMRHTALAARSKLWWTRLLLARGHADDHATAHRLLDDAATTAARLGLGLLKRDIAHTSATSPKTA